MHTTLDSNTPRTQAHSRQRLTAARPVRVLKVGGTSVGAADTLRRIVEIVCRTAASNRVIVVASAASGVTDLLVQAVDTTEAGTTPPEEWVDRVEHRHQRLAAAVLSSMALAQYHIFLRVHLAALGRVLERIVREGATPEHRDEVLAAGERLSAPLLAAALEEAGLRAQPVDAMHLIRTDAHHGHARVDRAATYRTVQQWYADLPDRTVPVVTGFIGATEAGAVTTLGRGGSDYSAALLAAALQADVVERWTDVDGLYTEDPRRSSAARRLGRVALDDAQCWNRAGRFGMHAAALEPLLDAGIPLHVRSTRAPDEEGTWLLPSTWPQAKAC